MIKKVNLNEIADRFEESGLKVADCTTEWVKVYDYYLWDNLVAYIFYDEDEKCYYYRIHIPAEWNNVIERDVMYSLYRFAKEVGEEVDALNEEMEDYEDKESEEVVKIDEQTGLKYYSK